MSRTEQNIRFQFAIDRCFLFQSIWAFSHARSPVRPERVRWAIRALPSGVANGRAGYTVAQRLITMDAIVWVDWVDWASGDYGSGDLFHAIVVWVRAGAVNGKGEAPARWFDEMANGVGSPPPLPLLRASSNHFTISNCPFHPSELTYLDLPIVANKKQ